MIALQVEPYSGTYKESVAREDENTLGEQTLQPRWSDKGTSGMI